MLHYHSGLPGNYHNSKKVMIVGKQLQARCRPPTLEEIKLILKFGLSHFVGLPIEINFKIH